MLLVNPRAKTYGYDYRFFAIIQPNFKQFLYFLLSF